MSRVISIFLEGDVVPENAKFLYQRVVGVYESEKRVHFYYEVDKEYVDKKEAERDDNIRIAREKFEEEAKRHWPVWKWFNSPDY